MAREHPAVDPKFPIIKIGKKIVNYDMQSHQFVQGKDVVARLPKQRHLAFLDMLLHPDQLLTFERMFERQYGNSASIFSPSEKKQRSAAAGHYRGALGQIREALASIDSSLPETVETIRGSGVVFTPHQSVRGLAERKKGR